MRVSRTQAAENRVTFGSDGMPKVTVSKYQYTCK